MTDAIEIALISDDNDQINSLAVWDVRNGTQLMQYKGGGAVGKHSLDLIKGNFLITANNLKPLLAIWPVNSSDIIQNVKFVLPARANSLAISPDGCYLIAGIQENIYIWQIATGKMLAMLSKHYQPINRIKFVDDGSHFITGGQDGMVLVWSLSDCIGDQYKMEPVVPLYSFSDHALPVTDLWVGNCGMRALLVSVSLDRSCKMYDLASGTMLLSVVFQEMLTAVVMDRVEIGLYVGTNMGNIYHYRMQPAPRTKEYHITDADKLTNKFAGHSKTITCLSISMDEQTLMSGSEDANVMIWNIQSRSLLKTLPHKGAITNAFFIMTPKVMFNRDAKLDLITSNLQRMIDNNDNREHETIDVIVKADLYEQLHRNKKKFKVRSSQSQASVSTEEEGNTSEVKKLKAEIEKLKKVNKEMFELSAKFLIE
ncbi:unnamed protein product [Diamesa serratosioi]